MIYTAVNPALTSLHEDPDFQKLEQNIGLRSR
jgi:hypothetical protein